MIQDVAERVGREAKALLFSPRVMPMDAFEIAQLPQQPCVVFVISTTGQVRTGHCRSPNPWHGVGAVAWVRGSRWGHVKVG